MTEDRSQKTEDRRQMTEDRRRRTDDRGQKTEGSYMCFHPSLSLSSVLRLLSSDFSPLSSVLCLLPSLVLFFALSGCARSPSHDVWNFWGDARKEKEHYERRLQYAEAHPELSERTRDKILRGRIWKGMTKEEAIASWGIPINILREEREGGVVEKWIYRPGYYYPERYLLFDRYKLVDWEEGKR